MMALDDECDTSGEDARVGRLVHEAAARAGLTAGLHRVESLSAGQLEQIARAVIRGSEDKVGPLSIEGWRSVVALTKRLADTYEYGPPAFPIGCEYEVPVERELDGWRITCRMDWRWFDVGENVAWIRDYKSGGKQAAREASFQAEVYAWETMGERPNLDGCWFGEHALPYGGPRWVWIGADELGDVESYLSDMIVRIEGAYDDQPFLATPGSHCDTMCADRAGCPVPEWAKGAGVGTDAEARAAVDRVTVSRAQSAHLTKAVKAYVEDKGLTSVRGSGDLEYAANADGSKWQIRKAGS